MMTATLDMTQSTSEFPVVQPQTDEQLLIGYRQSGDRDLFTQLVERYERELFNYLRRYLNDTEMAEDVFQSTFLQIHLKCESFEEGRRFRPWLYTIATNQAIDAQRRNKRHKIVSLDRGGSSQDSDDIGTMVDLLISSDPTPLSLVDQDERQTIIRDAVNQLPENLKQVVVLVYYQGLKYREAADVLGIPVGTVKSRLHSAVLKLTESWNSAYASEDNDA